MKITIDRSTVERVLEALSLALSDVDWRANSPTQPVIHKAHTALKAALVEPVQQKEHCLWARNGNEPCPHAQQAEPVQEPVSVYQWRKQGCADWYDGHPDYSDCGGPYETRTLYAAPPQRKPLTDDDLRKLADKHLFHQPESYEVSGVFALARAVEAEHHIK